MPLQLPALGKICTNVGLHVYSIYLNAKKMMPVQEINSNYIFTDGEVLSFKVDYEVPGDKGLEIWATVKIQARHALPHDKFEYRQLELNFSSVISLFIAEDFNRDNKISNMTLKKLDDGVFYISLYPFNNDNEPHEKDNFVIKAKNFTFDLIAN